MPVPAPRWSALLGVRNVQGAPVSDMATERIWEVARGCLTVKQYDALFLHAGRGLSTRQIALDLGISRQAVTDRLWNARRKLQLALEAEKMP